MFSPSRHPNQFRRTQRFRGQPHSATTALQLGVLLSLALAVAPAQADTPFEGRYQGGGEGRLTLKVSSRSTVGSSAAYRVDAFTGIPNTCSGTISGVARRVDTDTLQLKVKGDEAVCEITLRFSPDRKRVRMEEQGCGDFHGMSCAFGGALTRR